jgi:hypothetical protein
MVVRAEVLRRLEGAIAVAQQHRDVVVSSVSRRKVRLPIAIQVDHGHGIRIKAHREALCRLEGPIAVAQQQRDVVGI